MKERKRRLILIFGNTKLKKPETEIQLSIRIQERNKTVTDYVQAVLGLCKLVDVKLSYEDKAANFIKVVLEDVLHFVSVKEVDTVDGFTNSSRHFEAQRRYRVAINRFERLTNVNSVAAVGVYSDVLSSSSSNPSGSIRSKDGRNVRGSGVYATGFWSSYHCYLTCFSCSATVSYCRPSLLFEK